MELLSDFAEQNKFVLMMLQRKTYLEQIHKLIKNIKKRQTRVCYVCLSKPYTDVIEDLKNEKIDYENFIFVDVLSSLNYNLKPTKNCIFVSDPENIKELQKAIHKATRKHDCELIIFDTISTLLIYQQTHSIIKFTHELIMDEKQKTINKVYLVLKDNGVFKDENAELVKDLNLFADEVIEE